MSIELRLLNSVMLKDVYSEVASVFTPTSFSEELEDVATAIVTLHSELNCDLDCDIVREHLFNTKVNTTAKKALMETVLDKVCDAAPVTADAAKKFVFQLSRKRQRLDALNKLAQIIEKNEDSHEEVVTILNKLPVETEADNEIVDLDISNLQDQYDPDKMFPFRIPRLTDAVGGMARGNLAIVFGRPESGKSSFVANEVAGYILNGHTVDYYANEEPGRKIALNIRRAVTGETDHDITDSIRDNTEPDSWVKVKPFLRVRQIGDISIDTIMARAAQDKPDIIVLDQVDKMSIQGKYSSTPDRLKALYERTRVLAKTQDCLVINVSQASAEGDGVFKLNYSFLENSKTGKPGEADIIIGIGLNRDATGRLQSRGITISKNKINGWLGTVDVAFDRFANQWSTGE